MLLALTLVTPVVEAREVESERETARATKQERPAFALPTAHVERATTPVADGPRFVTALSTVEFAAPPAFTAPRAGPVERGAWRGVKHARLRACPPQGPPSFS